MRITPLAYQKLVWFMRRGNTEVTGFGLLDAEEKDLIIDFNLVKQTCSTCTIDMDKEGMAEYVQHMYEKYEISPAQCFRIWIHTHPGNSNTPSGTDEEQFKELMEQYPWFVMMIMAQDESIYCRLGHKINNEAVENILDGAYRTILLNVEIDWTVACPTIDFEELEAQYNEFVSVKTFQTKKTHYYGGHTSQHQHQPSLWEQNYEEIDWTGRNSVTQQLPGECKNDIEEVDWEEEIDINDLAEKSLHELTDEEWEHIYKWKDQYFFD